jgi:hypothetical protein
MVGVEDESTWTFVLILKPIKRAVLQFLSKPLNNLAHRHFLPPSTFLLPGLSLIQEWEWVFDIEGKNGPVYKICNLVNTRSANFNLFTVGLI